MTYLTIQTDGSQEEIIKKSRFICQVKRISSEDEGRAFIATIKKEHYKANHSCSAMIIGENSTVKRSSDDGEPSGTAGVPMLTVLEKQGLTNVVAVITRYFGGIKLGSGGLIRAYSGVLAHTIDTLGKVQIKEQSLLDITLSYPQYQTFDHFIQDHKITLVDSQFTQEVIARVSLDPDDIKQLTADLTDHYHGSIPIKDQGKLLVEVPVI